MPKSFDTEYKPEIICPYCNHYLEYNNWEEDQEYHETECTNCDQTFQYMAHVDIKYSTKKLSCKNNIPKHDYSLYYVGRDGTRCYRCKVCDQSILTKKSSRNSL